MRPAHHIHYAFDPAGRRERITGCSHAADPAEAWQFKRFSEWDAANRLTAVVQKTGAQKRIEMTYDYQWRRITRTVKNSGGTVESQQGWAWRGWMCLGEYRIVSGTWTLERALTWGPDLSGNLTGAGGVGGLYMFEEKTGTTTGVPAGTYSPLYDGNGNICELLNASGTVAAHYDYDAFGKVTATGPAAASPWRFSTKPQDSETALCYYGYRYYDPATGRWVNRDPIEEEGGENLTLFNRNNAMSFIDNLGLNPLGNPTWDLQPNPDSDLVPQMEVSVSGNICKCDDGDGSTVSLRIIVSGPAPQGDTEVDKLLSKAKLEVDDEFEPSGFTRGFRGEEDRAYETHDISQPSCPDGEQSGTVSMKISLDPGKKFAYVKERNGKELEMKIKWTYSCKKEGGKCEIKEGPSVFKVN